MLHSKIATIFAEAAAEVVLAETGIQMYQGHVHLSHVLYQPGDLTVVISLVGQPAGTALYAFSTDTALNFVARLTGEAHAALTTLERSALAELGNVITGRALNKLAELGYFVTLSPPILLLGTGTALSTLDLPRMVIPLQAEAEPLQMEMHLALRNIPL